MASQIFIRPLTPEQLKQKATVSAEKQLAAAGDLIVQLMNRVDELEQKVAANGKK